MVLCSGRADEPRGGSLWAHTPGVNGLLTKNDTRMTVLPTKDGRFARSHLIALRNRVE